MTIATPPASARRLSPTREQAVIRALRTIHNQALAARDVEAVVQLALDDFKMILGGGHLIQGKAAYRAFVVQAFAEPDPILFVRIPDRIDVGAPAGPPEAAETGRWTGTVNGQRAPAIGGR